MIPLYCLTTQANTSEFELLFNQISDVTDKYVNLGMSILGVTFNILSLLVLMDLNLTHNFYDFLRCRCVCNLTVCTIGLLYASFGDSRLCGTMALFLCPYLFCIFRSETHIMRQSFRITYSF